MKLKFTLICLLSVALVACGGSSKKKPSNRAPTATAPSDFSAVENTNVQLDGSASSDSDGSIASYSWSQTSGVSVTLNNATSAITSFTAPDIADPANTEVLTFSLVVTDDDGSTATDTVTVTIVDENASATISGQVTYDYVPHSTSNSLNYNGTEARPVRGAIVQLLNSANTVLDTTVSDASGNYQFDVSPNVSVKVRVLAQMMQTGTPGWNFTVVDNTNGGALYSMEGSLSSSGNGPQTRNLHADSGWGGSSYTGTRTAAPFAILDGMYQSYNKVLSADPDLNFPDLELNWSVNNVPSSGDKANGQIGTSHYQGGKIYILGAANNDTDEYDDHVIIHEWAHYFEDLLARSDSIGGQHGSGDRLDPRVAFGEGWGNAWSGIATDDPVYRDSYGNQQGNGFSINVDSNSNANAGWYNEGSVQSIIYDAYDSSDDGADTVSLGFTPIYNVLVGPQKDTPALTTIFSFVTYLKQESSAEASAISSLVSGQSIVGGSIDIYGSTESNNAGNATYVLPVYSEVTPGGASQQVCSTDSFGVAANYKHNKIGARRYLRFTIGSAGSYHFSANSTTNSGDPDILVFNRGSLVNGCSQADPRGCSGTVGSESMDLDLQVGDYSMEVYDYNNVDDGSTGGSNCLNVSITAN